MLYCATEDCCVWHIHIETSKSLSTEHLSAYGQSQAALFNQTEIALILMDSGANIQRKNGQGETPLDCAPPMLQYKMRQRVEELAASQRPV
ncbi:unnamed protein product [Triticum turgidum subsp. durum]|uniref:Uncharacterized protein n=1 Tax=Triticum turgidum subsp. durum TaxID=4567 RepID=A0A9R1NMT8_TRITD|nr:unnamed protein product [Triticum turgidum subsp. durum]